MLGMVTKVQYKNTRKGSYGFVMGYDGESYWFSLRGIEDIQPGTEVSFRRGRNEKGLVATEVNPVS